jgi:hypothetical protein
MITKRQNQSGIARELGVTRQRISQLVRDGILRPGRHGLFDVERAKAAYESSRGLGVTASGPPSAVSTLVEARTKQTLARTELLESTAEIQKQRAAERRGVSIQTAAAAIVTSQILERVYRSLDTAFFKFCTLIPEKHIVAIDILYRDTVRRAFTTALADRHIRKHSEFLRDKCALIAAEIDAEIRLRKIKKLDFETLTVCQKFAGEMQALLFDMSRPGIIAELTSYVPARIHPEAEPGNE